MKKCESMVETLKGEVRELNQNIRSMALEYKITHGTKAEGHSLTPMQMKFQKNFEEVLVSLIFQINSQITQRKSSEQIFDKTVDNFQIKDVQFLISHKLRRLFTEYLNDPYVFSMVTDFLNHYTVHSKRSFTGKIPLSHTEVKLEKIKGIELGYLRKVKPKKMLDSASTKSTFVIPRSLMEFNKLT